MAYRSFIRQAIWLSLYANVFCPGCKGPVGSAVTDTPNNGSIRISVDESFEPVVREQIRVYEGLHPGTRIIASYKPEAECLKDLVRDSATRMVIVTRGLSRSEERYFSDSIGFVPSWDRLASDAIALVVNGRSNDTLYTREGLRKLLSGQMDNRKKLVFDGLSATSAYRLAVDSILKGAAPDSEKVKAVKGSAAVLDFVASDTNAVGFLGFSWIGNPDDPAQRELLKKVKIAYIRCEACGDSPYVKPTQWGIMTKRYPLVRGFYTIVKENYSGLGSGFAAFMRFEKGQLIFRRAYLSPGKIGFNERNVRINENPGGN
jgi:phosphate transport system substrate-binding protein